MIDAVEAVCTHQNSRVEELPGRGSALGAVGQTQRKEKKRKKKHGPATQFAPSTVRSSLELSPSGSNDAKCGIAMCVVYGMVVQL